MTDTEHKEKVNTDEEVVVEAPNEVVIDDKVEIDKSIQKPKRPRTQKQIEAFQKCQETRRLKNEEKKRLKEANKKPRGRPKKVVKINPEPVVEEAEELSSESSEEELSSPEVVYKKKPKRKKEKPKPKKKKRIVYLSSSSSESEDDYVFYEGEDAKNKIIQRQKELPKSQQRPIRALKYSDVIKFL